MRFEEDKINRNLDDRLMFMCEEPINIVSISLRGKTSTITRSPHTCWVSSLILHLDFEKWWLGVRKMIIHVWTRDAQERKCGSSGYVPTEGGFRVDLLIPLYYSFSIQKIRVKLHNVWSIFQMNIQRCQIKIFFLNC